MILPSKHLSQDRALLTVGARILKHLSNPITVSALWEDMTHPMAERMDKSVLHYDAFVLTLDLLYLIGAIELWDGLLYRRKP